MNDSKNNSKDNIEKGRELEVEIDSMLGSGTYIS